MSQGSDIVALGRQHVGERYRLGARANFTNANFQGPWDCAEFATWVVFQATGETVLLGCSPREPTRGDAYTGYWYDDATRFGLIVSVAEGLATEGAMLLRRPAQSRIGHIAISCGNRRQTVEAKDTRSGVVIGNADPTARGWEFGVRIPTPQEWTSLTRRASAPKNWFLRELTSRAEDARVAQVKESLRQKGAWKKPVNGIYGPDLSKSIAGFQKA